MVQGSRQKRSMFQSPHIYLRSNGIVQSHRSIGEVGICCSITWPQVARRLAPFVGQARVMIDRVVDCQGTNSSTRHFFLMSRLLLSSA